ncbi:MAG: PKD domain-containing protein [Ferruginibacter sp.]
MKIAKYILGLSFLLLIAFGCKKTDYGDTGFIQTDQAPAKLSAMFDITQDNTGLVTITPNGEGISYFEILYGDGTTEAVSVTPGKDIQHVYAEGVYNVKIIGHSITGKITEATQQLTVSFRQPEDLDFTLSVDAANNFKVNVVASAKYETLFKVYFGETADEVPVSVLEGETANHTYTAVGTYTVKVVAMSGGAAVAELTKTVEIVDPVLLPLTFESPTLNYTFTNFGGGSVTVIDNPQSNGINTSSKVGKMIKNAPEVWGGSFITLGKPIDFSANKVFRMKVFSPRVGAKVLLKVENASDGSISYEKEATSTVANAWEDLAFDYSGINTSNSYHKIVLIFELGTAGDGSANFTFLFDDIRLTNTLPSSLLSLPVTFDDPNVPYTISDFGNNQTVNDVDPANASNKVKKTTKPNGAETWAGSTLSPGLAAPVPFAATATKMSVRVYSPAAGITIKLKAEEKTNNTHSVETDAVTTVANAWETLVFDFANNSSGTPALNLSYAYDLVSVFFDFGKTGDGKVFYWDDVSFVTPPATVLGLPLDFESSTLSYDFVNFDGGNVTIIDNPNAGGINSSSKVGKMVKGAGQPWGGSFITLPNAMDFSGSKTFKMKVFSPRVGAKVLLKVENATDGNVNFEKEATTTKANEWEELSFDYSGINTANAYHKVVLIFELGTQGDGSSNFTFLFDDIKLN